MICTGYSFHPVEVNYVLIFEKPLNMYCNDIFEESRSLEIQIDKTLLGMLTSNKKLQTLHKCLQITYNRLYNISVKKKINLTLHWVLTQFVGIVMNSVRTGIRKYALKISQFQQILQAYLFQCMPHIY